ncbi:hypothetical protein D3C74_407760 [compost metagenome]
MLFNALIQQIVLIGVMQIDGPPVHIGPLGDIMDGDLTEILFGKKLQKGLADGFPGSCYPSV